MSKLFKFYKNDVKIKFQLEKIKDIMKMDYHLPKCQRRINDERINIMSDNFKTNFNPITPIYFCIFNKKRYVIDGQHRLTTYKSLTELYNTKIPVVEIQISNEKEMYNYFKLINDNMVLNSVWKKDEDIKEIILKTFDYFVNKYPKTFEYGTRKNKPKPYLNKETFLEQLTYLIEDKEEYDIVNIYNITNSDDFINIIDNLNKKYSEQTPEWFGKQRGKMTSLKIINKIIKHKMLYFGLLQQNWLCNINEFEQQENQELHNGQLSQSLRQACWTKWMPNKFNSKCWCCNINEVSAFNFEAGHVKARNLGGLNTIENLRPICGFCNKAMGIKNMFIYMKEMDYNIKID